MYSVDSARHTGVARFEKIAKEGDLLVAGTKKNSFNYF
jgi:hypothetical protein